RGGVLGPALRAREAPRARPPAARRRDAPHARATARAGHRLEPARGSALRAPRVEGICETLEPFADIVCVVDRLATFETVSAYLGEGFDLIHYCGHVVSGEDTGPALVLADSRPLSAAVIEPNVAGRPLVFLNACASARERQGPPSGAWEATVSSVA